MNQYHHHHRPKHDHEGEPLLAQPHEHSYGLVPPPKKKLVVKLLSSYQPIVPTLEELNRSEGHTLLPLPPPKKKKVRPPLNQSSHANTGVQQILRTF